MSPKQKPQQELTVPWSFAFKPVVQLRVSTNMIKPFLASLVVAPLSAFSSSSQSLSRAVRLEIAAPCSGLEHISEALAAIYATLTGDQWVNFQSGGGRDRLSPPRQNIEAAPPVTTSYPVGGVS